MDDDDIDIEEHDILQHPHIKQLFPDFSQVKIEVHGADVAENIAKERDNQLKDDDEIPPIPPNVEEEQLILPDYPPQNFYEISHAIEEDPIEISDDIDDVAEIQEEISNNHTTQEEEISNCDQYQDDQYQNGEDREEFDIQIKEENIDDEIDEVNEVVDELPPEDIYHFNNKIILGTKPCQSLNTRVELFDDYPMDEDDDEDIQKEYLPVSVLLEDWKTHLDNCKTYCFECEILFATRNALDAHNMVTHSLLVAVTKNVARKSTTKSPTARKSTSSVVKTGRVVKNQARKSTGSKMLSSKFCNHCNMQFPDHTALIKHLYELLPLKKFNCNLCDSVFNSQKELMDHNAYHIKIEKSKIKQEKIANDAMKKKLVFEEDVKKTRRREPLFIPKSVLFQCTKCKVHFLTITSGYKHLVFCKSSLSTARPASCDICKRKFRYEDEKVHKKQHDQCNKFKVYKITTNLYERTLCQCPKCSVFFNEFNINRHLKICGKVSTNYCSKCDISIPKTAFQDHTRKHTNDGLKRKDFVMIKYVLQNKAKRKLEPIASVAKKPKLSLVKIVPKIKKEVETIDKHENQGKLFGDKEKLRYFFCGHCSCCSVIDRPRAHINKKCLKQRKEYIGRWICNKCGLCFRPKCIKSHQLKHRKRNFNIHNIIFIDMISKKPIVPPFPNYPQCQKCRIKFNKNTFLRQHTCGENYVTCKVCHEKFDVAAYHPHMEIHKAIKSRSQKIPSNIPRPALVKRTETNQILYKCEHCDIITDCYDKAVEHSQNHESNPNKKTIKCYICNLKFDETCWSNHSSLHSKMTITAADFKVLTYNPSLLLTEDWFELFLTVTPTQRKQIVKNSLYSIERGTPMKLVKPGKIDYTLYVCNHCQMCFENSEITTHVNTQYCPKQSKNVCKYCRLTFQDPKRLIYHELLHQQGVTSQDFRVVHFYKPIRQLTNKITPSLKGHYTIYKCKQCHACLMHKINLGRHKCLKSTKTIKCKECDQLYFKAGLSKHKLIHKNEPNFKKSNITIEYFHSLFPLETNEGPSFKTKLGYKKTKPDKASKIVPVKPAKVYKCPCGLHYTSLQSIEKHFESCAPENKVHAENCSKCGLLFPTDILVSHLCKHHSSNTEIIIEEYKVLTNVQSTTNIAVARRAMASAINDFDYKVYKCSACDIYFMAQSTCYKHVYKRHVYIDPMQCIECKICGLQFKIKTLDVHVQRHHKNTFSLDRVLVEEYSPPTNERPMKIDIYKATDKLQSLQVSSSIEESSV